VKADMLRAAKIKIANSDVYSEGYAGSRNFWRVVGMAPLERMLLIEGGALAVENTLKAAMDWKVRKNMAAGRRDAWTRDPAFPSRFHGGAVTP
jgi:L-lysine 6-transaminase